jgi:pimeloyl-ACP methyl ester carboxylesterase
MVHRSHFAACGRDAPPARAALSPRGRLLLMKSLRWMLTALVLLSSLSLRSEASVAQRHVTASSAFDIGILHVERFGRSDRRSIVFIPALFCGSWEWNAQIDTLSNDYDVIVVTLPGFDGRRMVAGADLMERAAESLHLLIVTHRLIRPIVVGHSLGGTLAIFFAERYPHDLTNLVTVEGGYPVAPTQALRDARVAKSIQPYEGLAQAQLEPVLRETQLQYTITSKDDVDTVAPLAARSDPAAIVAWMRAALSLDLTPGLSPITVPFTLIVPFDSDIDPYQGFKSMQQKQATYVQWASHAPNSRVILIDHSRHFVMFDQPEKFAQALGAAIVR